MKSSKGNISRTRPVPMRKKLCGALLLAMLACTAPSWAQRNDAPQVYSISAGDLAGALDQLASQSKVQILYPAELVRGKRTAAVSGSQTWREALQQLLAGTGLTYGFVNDTTVVIRKSEQVKALTPATPATAVLTKKNPQPQTQDMEKVTVTGTRIRGGSTPSPVITIGSEQIQQEGFADLGEVIRSIPQNFSGGQNPGVAAGASTANLSNMNITGSSALNLRGLGPDATLSLLNGHRLTYEGYVQAVDISAIPIEAVERIEIMPDGASAIYGSDAVAGVANVILKRDFDGVTLGTRYGRATSNGLGTHEYTVTAGTTWSSGGLIATYKKVSQDPIFSDQRDYTRAVNDPNTLYAGNDLRSALVSAHQALGDMAQLQVDVLRTDRGQSRFIAYPGYYVRTDGRTAVSQVSPNVEFSLPADWTLTVGGTHGKDESIIKMHMVTGDASSLQTDNCYCNKSNSYELGAEGPLFALGGTDARLAIGVGTRTNEFLVRSFLSGSRRGGKEQSRFGYAEINLPVISPASQTKGAHRLEFSAAARSEDYESFERVLTPKLGMIYGPSADFTLKASWGKSFKAPTLLQRYEARSAYLWSAKTVGGAAFPDDATVLMSYGGKVDLKPERARTWTTSLAFHPELLPGLEAELTYFDIDYTDRVVVPIKNTGQALSNPIYAQFVHYSPTAEQQAALLAIYGGTFYNLAGADYDPSKVVALAFDQYINATRQRIKGADLSGSYRFDLGAGRLALRGAATWLNSSQQNSSGQPMFDLAGTIFYPAKLKSRFGAVWARGGLAISGFANYTGGVTSKLVASTEKTASFTTLDATFSYNTGDRKGALSGLEIVLSADNLLNRDPPLYTTPSPAYVPYDSTNYSAIGRYLSLSISKHW